MNDIDKKEVVDLLNRILESELAGVVSADLRADLAEGACFNDTPVEVSRA